MKASRGFLAFGFGGLDHQRIVHDERNAHRTELREQLTVTGADPPAWPQETKAQVLRLCCLLVCHFGRGYFKQHFYR